VLGKQTGVIIAFYAKFRGFIDRKRKSIGAKGTVVKATNHRTPTRCHSVKLSISSVNIKI
jgi:hypothetical protein